jgi:flagellar biosynthetic protein FliR
MPAYDLLSLSPTYVDRLILAAVRVLAALSLNPVLGTTRMPALGRIGLGLFITLALFPPGGPEGEPVTFGVSALIGELLIGLLAGFVVALVFVAVQAAAALIGVTSGFNLAGTLNPSLELGQGALDQFFSILAIVVFVQSGGHHLFLIGINELFAAVPVGTVSVVPQGTDGLAIVTTALLSAAIKMVFPVVAALLLADLGLAILAKVAPQLNLFAIGLPAKALITFGAIAVAMPWFLPRLVAMFRDVPNAMLMVRG